MNPKLYDYAMRQFHLDPDGVHGPSHWIRVAYRGAVLARVTGANPSVVHHFALLHDYLRHDDGEDPEHGKRASNSLVSLRLAGLLDLDEAEMSDLYTAIRFHSDGRTAGNATVQTCWDADRLDLWRVGVMPSERFLCTQAAKDMLRTMEFPVYEDAQ